MANEQGPLFSSGMGVAMRIGVELVVATLVGTALGWWGDGYFGTAPWLMIVGIILGAAAGFRNIHRYIQQMQGQD
jgi:ATP synthase protein I